MSCVLRAFKSGKSFPFNGCSLSKAQAEVLLFISHTKDGASAKDLAKYLQVTGGAITQIIDGLVEKGLVNRVECDEDRRIQFLALTKKAHGAFTKFKKEYYLTMLPMFDALSEKEIAQLTALLNKIDSSKIKDGGD